MFRRWLHRFRSKPLPEPEWWRTDDYDRLSSERLMMICDGFWDERAMEDGRVPSYGHSAQAAAELSNRGSEVIPWALAHLAHADYDARQSAADLLGSLAERNLLGAHTREVVAELSKLALRPRGQETKEIQANCAAVSALGATRDPAALPVFRRLLLTDGWWSDDDIRWNAAEALQRFAGEPFMSADDPESAAAEWLRRHGA